MAQIGKYQSDITSLVNGDQHSETNNDEATADEDLDDLVLPYCGENPNFKGASSALDVRYLNKIHNVYSLLTATHILLTGIQQRKVVM